MITVKRNDTAPSLQSTLSDNGAVVNLTTASAIRVIGSRQGVVLFDRTVTGNSVGVVNMPWQSGDTAYLGPIRVEWEVTWPDGGIQTFPASGYETVWVTKDNDSGIATPPPAFGLFTESYTYNVDGTIASKTIGGVTTTYTYNVDGTVHTDTTVGVTRLYAYDVDLNVTSITVV